MDVWYMCLFCVCVALCSGRGLATGWSLVQGVLPSVNEQNEKNNLATVRYKRNGLSKYSVEWESYERLIGKDREGRRYGLLWIIVPTLFEKQTSILMLLNLYQMKREDVLEWRTNKDLEGGQGINYLCRH
jgi:hypothetical protein